MKKMFYKPSELAEMGYPKERILQLCRSGKIGRKSDPKAKRGYHWLITKEEVERYWR